MSDTTTAALITGIFAITLFCLKYIVNCLFPGKCSGNLLVGACCKKPDQINPLLTLETCWEERIINKNGTKKLDQSTPRGYHNNEDGHYAKKDSKNDTWIVTLTKEDVEEEASVYLFFPFEKKANISKTKHFFRCKIKYISDESSKNPEAFIRIKRFRTEKIIERTENNNEEIICNNYAPPKSCDVISDHPILFDYYSIGIGEYNKNTYIGNTVFDGASDVSREQIGIYFKSSGKYIIEEAYYSDEKMNIISCPGCFYSFYKIEDANLPNENV